MFVLANLLGSLILFFVIVAGVWVGNSLDRQAHRVGAWFEKNRSIHVQHQSTQAKQGNS